LSQPALETLAIIAYKQPMLRAEIESIRGVDVGGVLRMLLEKKLIKIMGRKNVPGRPIIYGTTQRFLEVFSLKDISSLPTMEEIGELSDPSTTVKDDEESE
jgi:segregation and condensation protein B